MTSRCRLAVLLLLAMGAPAAAQTTLEWEVDETFYLDVRHSARQEIVVFEKTAETDVTVRFVFKLRPTKVGRDGTTFEVTCLACEDSSHKKGAEKEVGALKGFADQKFKLTASARNKGIELSGLKDLPEAVFGDEARNGTVAEKAFLADMVEVVLRVHLLDAFTPLPEKAVVAGDKWRNKADLTLQPLVKLTTDREYVLTGPQIHDGKRVQAVNWTSQVDIKPLEGDLAKLPFKILGVKQAEKARNDGTMLWDTAANRPIRVDSLQSYHFDMTLEVNEKEFTGKGKGTDSFVIHFSKTNPIAK